MPTYYDPVACEDVGGTERIFRLLANLDQTDPAAVERTGSQIAVTLNDMSAHERNKCLAGLLLMMNDLRQRVAILEQTVDRTELGFRRENYTQ